MEKGTIPRMRTITKAVAEIKTLDPGSDITEHYLRQFVKTGELPVKWAGRKALINMDELESLLRQGTPQAQPEPCTVDGIRRIDVILPRRV